MTPLRRISFISGLLAAALATPSLALEPADIVILYNKASPSSLEIANYYATARQIPRDHILPIDHCPVQEFIAQSIYQNTVQPEVIAGLEKIGMKDKVKCLVTTLDVPLRIEAVIPTNEKKTEFDADQKSLTDITNQLHARLDEYNRIALQAATTTQAATPAIPADAKDWQKAAAELNVAANQAARRISTLTGDPQQAALAEMVNQQEQTGGLVALLATIHVRPDSPNEAAAQKRLTEVQSRVQDIERQVVDLKTHMDLAENRAKLIALRKESHGLIGAAEMTEEVINYLNPPESEASLDNELAMCFADQNYPRAKWVLNPHNVEFYPMIKNMRNVPRTVLVCRVDGSTVEKTEEMIRTTLVVEKKGLEGKMYLDARGLHGTDGYAQFDAKIRDAADWLKTNSTMEVVLDDKPELFKYRDCPDAALYCGWYSVHHYVDTCQWVPGAVGYHVASFEMTSLHTFREQGWVVNLLDRGFCGTEGPVNEPYLHSFPKPNLFFPLLLSGQFTQGEVWELTCPLLSWQQAYVGDPLYNPFKLRPRVKVESLKADTVLKNAFDILPRQ